jgi:4-amino-4-deoxychorismate lyase
MQQATGHGLSVHEQMTQTQLLSASELFVCNSIIGIWPIKRLENSHFLVGPITQRIQGWLASVINDDRMEPMQ